MAPGASVAACPSRLWKGSSRQCGCCGVWAEKFPTTVAACLSGACGVLAGTSPTIMAACLSGVCGALIRAPPTILAACLSGAW
eukprot:1162035-Pelagomonas_calceolata.AAC.16